MLRVKAPDGETHGSQVSHRELGLATHLITSCLSFLSKFPRQSQAQLPSRSPQNNEFGRFRLWALGFDTSGGQFDELLEQAQYLKEPTVVLLSNFAVLLYKHFAEGSDGDTLIALESGVKKAKEVYPYISHFCYDSDSEEDTCWIVEELREIVDSLFRLAPALDEIQEEVSSALSPTQCYKRIILEKFPNARLDLVLRLAKANEYLFKSLMNPSKQLSKEIFPDPGIMEAIPAAADVQKKPPPYSTSHAQSSAAQPAAQPSTAPSTMRSSMFRDSGIGSSCATSLTVPKYPPRAQSVSSEITKYSNISSLENRSAILQLPKSQGMAREYDCPICHHKQTKIRNDHEWRKHIFADIKPYMCTYETCRTGGKSFESWKLWMEHEKKEHRSRSIDEESYTKSCPLCLQEIESSQESFYKHVRRHMEDIRIIALPPSLRQPHDEDEPEANDASSGDFSSTKSIVGRSGVLSPISEEPSSELGSKFSSRYERTEALADLEQAIRLGQEEISATPKDHPDRAAILHNLGNNFSSRYKWTGALDDLEQAIRLGQEAVSATPGDHPDPAAILNNLGNHFSSRYERTGALDDLEQAIRLGQEAVSATPENHPDRAAILHNLGNNFSSRYKRTGVLDDLEQAIHLGQDALSATPDNHPDRAGRLNNLEQDIRLSQEAIPATPENHSSRFKSTDGRIQFTSSARPSLKPFAPSEHERPTSFSGHVPPSPAALADATSPEENNVNDAKDRQSLLPPSRSKTLWEKAVEKLEPEDRKQFNFDDEDKCEILTELLKEVEAKQQECEEKQWRYWKKNGDEVILRDIANRISTNLNKFADIVDTAFQYGPQPLSAAWTVFRFLLKVATNDMGAMTNLLSDLASISCILGRCAIYERLYCESDLKSAQDLIDSVPDLYTAILGYLCRSKEYFSQSTAVNFSPLTEEIKTLENQVEYAAQTAAEELQATANEKKSSEQQEMKKKLQEILKSLENPFQEMKRQVAEMKPQVAEIYTSVQENERSAILQWLSKVTFESHHSFINDKRQTGTEEWLLEKKEFIEWKESTPSSILWLHGIVGSGKTVLASFVIDIFKNWMSPNQALAYFYCKDGEKDRQDPKLILRTIVKQLSIGNLKEGLPKPVVSLYRKQKNDGLKPEGLELDQSKKLILELSAAFDQTIIVIDALDECDKSTRDQLLDALKSILELSTRRLKLFVTSRDDADIVLEFESVPNFRLEPRDNSSDIELFVTKQVERCISKKKLLKGKVKTELRELIIKTLKSKANGMFLWADFQIESICQEKTVAAIETALKRLPRGLEATYTAIWDRMCAQSEDTCLLAKKTLMWIIYANSPLTANEIIEAISIQPMQWTEQPCNDDLDDTVLLDICQNFIVMDKELGVLCPAHFSVTEFLRKKIPSEEAHTAAAEVCLTLLCYENHPQPQLKKPVRDHALAGYATKSWIEHVHSSGSGSSTLMALQEDFLNPSAAYRSWLSAAMERDYALSGLKNVEIQLTLLWVTSYYGVREITIHLLKRIVDREILNSRARPTHMVAACGEDMVTQKLLEKNMYLNVRNSRGETPLFAAVRNGKEAVVRALLEAGADKEAKDSDGRTALHVAAERGEEATIRALLEAGVDKEAKDGDGWTALHIALENGHQIVSEMLKY